MKTLLNFLVLALALVAGQSEACTAAATPVAPATTNRTFATTALGVSYFLVVQFNCVAGETYVISTPSSTVVVPLGTGGFNVTGDLCKTNGCGFLLFSNHITGTAATTGTISVNIFAGIGGDGNAGSFKGAGTYSMTLTMNITSSGGSPLTYTHLETGTVNGNCAVSAATANFGAVPSGTTNPITPVSITLNCTIGMAWSMSQSVAVQNVHIGTSFLSTAWLYSDAAGTVSMYTTPLPGTGTGVAQVQGIYVGLSGATQGSPIIGAGSLAGSSIQLMVTY